MDYPLNMTLAAPLSGFALANDEAEHIVLTAAGYLPAFVAPTKPKEPEKADTTREDMLAEAEKRGLKVDKRWSNERILEELTKA